MKYFTCELLDRYGSTNEEIATKAESEWEARVLQYKEEVASFKRTLPADFQKLETSYYLHDAKVLRFQVTGRLAFVQLVLVDTANLTLAYQLASDSPIQFDLNRNDLYWHYDEVSKHKEVSGAFLHSILFADSADVAVEVNISFDAFCLGHCGNNGDFESFQARLIAGNSQGFGSSPTPFLGELAGRR